MYITWHRHGTDYEHLHVAVERGFRRGTWEVRYEPAGPRWRVRPPHGDEEVLDASGPWVGDLNHELEELMGQIARRAVIETMNRRAQEAPKVREEVPAGGLAAA